MLQRFHGDDTKGHRDNLHKLTMARLSAGDASLLVKGGDKDKGSFSITGKIEEVSI